MSIRKTLLTASVALTLFAAGCGSQPAPTSSPQPTAAAAASPSATAAASPSATAAASPSASPASQFPRVFTDELGHEVKLEKQPARVFAPFLEDSLLVLGVKPVAQWSNGGHPQAYLQDKLADVPLAEFASGLPSPEVVASYNPDLIILHNSYYAENGVYEQYSKIAPTYVFKQAANDLEKSVAALGELLGKQAEAAKGLSDYGKKVEAAKAALAPVVKDKKAVIFRFNSRGMFMMGSVYGGYVLAHELGIGQSKLIGDAGSVDLSLEILPELDADFIFLVNDSANSGATFVKELTDSAIWKQVPAVKAGRVYEVDDRYWLGGGLIAYGKIIDDVLKVLKP